MGGGALMGMGTAMLPGGNDALLLSGMPMLSLHALPSFAMMLATIAAILLISKRFGGPKISANCQSDIIRQQ